MSIPLAYRFSRKEMFSNTLCNAAGRNLFIGTDGSAGPCCFNRKDIYGNILHDGLEEIAASEERSALRNKLRNGKPGTGCQICINAINSRNYKAAGSQNYDLLAGKKKQFPLFMEFELDTFCNLDCIMCPPELHSSVQHSLFSEDFAEKISPWLAGLKWAKFYGGEPFLIKIYYTIWEKILEVNPRCVIKIQTNGTILNERIKELLSRGRFQISLSLDTLNPVTYAEIRRGSELGIVLKNLDYFAAYAKKTGIAADVAVCPMTMNAGEIPEIIDYCNARGIYVNFNIVTEPKKWSLKYASSTLLQQTIDLLNNSRWSSRNTVLYQNRKHLKSLIRQLEAWKRMAAEKEQIPLVDCSREMLIALIAEKIPAENKDAAENKIRNSLSEISEQIRLREDIYNFIAGISSKDAANFINLSAEKMKVRAESIILFGE
jgi:MoaA/NifB/PqqE/SkfB family radical SAM enzyme